LELLLAFSPLFFAHFFLGLIHALAALKYQTFFQALGAMLFSGALPGLRSPARVLDSFVMFWGFLQGGFGCAMLPVLGLGPSSIRGGGGG
jgi:hypothetical protein